MSKDSTSVASQTDWEALEIMQDEDIDVSDIPEVTAEQMVQATLRVGGPTRLKRENPGQYLTGC